MTDRIEAAVRELVEALREEVRAEAATSPNAPDRLLSIDDACAALAVRRSRLYLELEAGRLRSVKVGRRRLIPSSVIRDYIDARSR